MPLGVDPAQSNDLSGLSYKARFANGSAWCAVQRQQLSVEDKVKLNDADAKRAAMLKDAEAKRAAMQSTTDHLAPPSIAAATDPAVIVALTDALKVAMHGGCACMPSPHAAAIMARRTRLCVSKLHISSRKRLLGNVRSTLHHRRTFASAQSTAASRQWHARSGGHHAELRLPPEMAAAALPP